MPLPDSRPDSPTSTVSDTASHKSDPAINDSPTIEEANTTVPIDVENEASSIDSSSKETDHSSSTTITPATNVVMPKIVISTVNSEHHASQGVDATSTKTDPVSHNDQDEDKCTCMTHISPSIFSSFRPSKIHIF